MTDKHIDRMCELLAAESDLTAEEVHRRLRLPLSTSRVSAILKEQGSPQKKSFVPTEQRRDDVKQRRVRFARRLRRTAARRFVSLDVASPRNGGAVSA
ncbi:MAG: hypothetical protein AAGJ46_12725 [Planctomycetota bacterium]